MTEKEDGVKESKVLPAQPKSKVIVPKPDYTKIKEFNLNVSLIHNVGQTSNPKTFNDLEAAFKDAQMLWEYTNAPRSPVIDNSPTPAETSLLQHISMGIACAKLLQPRGRIATKRVLTKQKQIIRNELLRNIESLDAICSLNELQGVSDLSHPFLMNVLSDADSCADKRVDQVIDRCSNPGYKKAEALFIRVSNAERKKINDAMLDCLKVSKRIYMLRFDIYSKGKFNVDHYRDHLDVTIGELNAISGQLMTLAVEVMYSRVVNFGTEGAPKGHLVVIFKPALSARTEFHKYPVIFNSVTHANIDVRLAAISQSGLKSLGHNSILSISNYDDIELLNDVAKFLTIERRLMSVRTLVDPEGRPKPKPHVLRIKKM